MNKKKLYQKIDTASFTYYIKYSLNYVVITKVNFVPY